MISITEPDLKKRIGEAKTDRHRPSKPQQCRPPGTPGAQRLKGSGADAFNAAGEEGRGGTTSGTQTKRPRA